MSEVQIAILEQAKKERRREIQKKSRLKLGEKYLQRHRTEMARGRAKDPERHRKIQKNSYKKHRMERLQKNHLWWKDSGYYARNREQICARNKARYRQLRLMCFEAYGGPKCKCCGEKTIEFLTLDHINGGGNKHRKEIGGAGSKMLLWLKGNGYPSGIQVLCYNCNSAKAYYGLCPHAFIQSPVS